MEDTVSILRGLKERYEVHHGVHITDGYIDEAHTYVTKAREQFEQALDIFRGLRPAA